jgi:hypothetical protein
MTVPHCGAEFAIPIPFVCIVDPNLSVYRSQNVLYFGFEVQKLLRSNPTPEIIQRRLCNCNRQSWLTKMADGVVPFYEIPLDVLLL